MNEKRKTPDEACKADKGVSLPVNASQAEQLVRISEALRDNVRAFRHKDTGEVRYILTNEHIESNWEDVMIIPDISNEAIDVLLRPSGAELAQQLIDAVCGTPEESIDWLRNAPEGQHPSDRDLATTEPQAKAEDVPVFTMSEFNSALAEAKDAIELKILSAMKKEMLSIAPNMEEVNLNTALDLVPYFAHAITQRQPQLNT